MKRFRILYKFLVHFFSARNTKGFGVHSPFVFQFTDFVLVDKSIFYVFPEIEAIRSNLRRDKRIINIKDFGTGHDRTRKVSEIAKCSIKSAKYGQLLYRIANYLKARDILELGTSLGLTTLYLASSSNKIQCVSLEGCPQTANLAKENFDKLGFENIKTVVGNIDDTLPDVINEMEKLDMVFIDANHRYESVIQYFDICLHKAHDNTVIIIDDIYWSADMEKAWERIKEYPKVKTTIDLFQFGIVFFNPDLYKKHYKMRY
ncbi:MAG: class I SAM-dependent methyltransferase [Paludibacter sp.]|nr:class I SAM-dependent methyltransferase [Paludibacter sp.]